MAVCSADLLDILKVGSMVGLTADPMADQTEHLMAANWAARMAGPTDEMMVGLSAVPMVVMSAASTADSKAELSAVRWVDSKEFPWAAATVERMAALWALMLVDELAGQ